VLRDLRTLGTRVHVVTRSAETVAGAHAGGAASVVPEIAALPRVEGVVIAAPTSVHVELAEEALGLGVPVYVEKPLSNHLASAERIVQVGGDRLFVMDKWRYHPGVRELARIAREDELGAVQSIHTRRVTHEHRYGYDQDTVWCQAPHDLAVALEILGFIPEPAHAVAETMNGERVGLIGTLGGPPWVHVEISCVAPALRRELRVVFEGGTASLDGGWAEEIRIVRSQHEGHEPELRPTPGELPLLAELRAFVEHLSGGPAPLSSADDALGIVRCIHRLGVLAIDLEAKAVAAR
jgi:predicted dehydrogenase